MSAPYGTISNWTFWKDQKEKSVAWQVVLLSGIASGGKFVKMQKVILLKFPAASSFSSGLRPLP